MPIDRRHFLAATALLGAVAGRAAAAGDPLIDEIERRTFRYFRDTTDAATGLAPDRWPSAPFASIAATGFALTAWPVGEARGWIDRAEARARTLATLRFFAGAPQGPEAKGVAGHKGFFYHFLDLPTGVRHGRCELSSVDTALLLGGVLFAREWFDRDHADEQEVRRLADLIHARVDWRWMQARGQAIAMGWRPETGFIAKDWVGYNEGMIVYLLALGAPVDPVAPAAWAAWTAGYRDSRRGEGAGRHLAFGPHFGHQYSHVWVDFRGIRDAFMRTEGFDYFENSRRATLAQHAYAVANPMGWRGYGEGVWGLTACDGPGRHARTGEGRGPSRGYSARGPRGMPDGFDDGTIAPTAALGSYPFAAALVAAAATALVRGHGPRIWREHGFIDAFNPSVVAPDPRGRLGVVVPGHGWVANDMLGIDQGPIVAMIANGKDELVWRTMRRSAALRRGLTRAGFTGGWLTA